MRMCKLTTTLKLIEFKHLALITITYCLTHYMLLIATGRWWDDLGFYNLTLDEIKLWCHQMGRPTAAYIFYFAENTSESFYRIITFFIFYSINILYYVILRLACNISKEACFWQTMILCVLPVNDARIMEVIFPYTIAYFLFVVAYAHLCFMLQKNRIPLVLRILNLVMFFFSFTMNSILCLYVTVILIVYFHAKNLKNNLNYIDYYILPIIFYVFKNLFFTPFGAYSGYNKIDAFSLILGLFNTILAIPYVFIDILKNLLMLDSLRNSYMAILVFICMLLYIINIYKNNKLNEISKKTKEYKSELLISILMLYFSLFPYVVIRHSFKISTYGINGRDSILVPLGMSMFIYYSTKILFSYRICKKIYICIIVASMCLFNLLYWAYQTDYYSYLGFKRELHNHPVTYDVQNILCINKDLRRINTWTFYSLNAFAEMVFNNQKRIMFDSDSFYQYYINNNNNLSKFIIYPWYHMQEIDYSYKKIDIKILYSCNLSIIDTMYLKYLELYDRDKFENALIQRAEITILNN